MRQETIQQEREEILSGKILGFGYNTISVKEDKTKNSRVIHFDGLQKKDVKEFG